MKKLYTLFFILAPFSFTEEVFAGWNSGDFDFKPIIYSRGGLTIKDDFSKVAPQGEECDSNGDNCVNYNQAWNMGPYGEETNSIAPALTELTLEITYKKQFKYVYGIDVKSNARFYEYDRGDDTDRSKLAERENYLTFYNGPFSIWFGQRAYRGTGEYLTGTFPFDELNLYGGGIRLENTGPINVDFALGIKEGNDLDFWDSDFDGTEDDQNEIEGRSINIFVNKIEFPFTNGMIKTNFQFHRNNALYANQRSNSYVAGIQFQKWGDQFLGGNLYNIFYINYSSGFIPEGYMQSAFNQANKDWRPSKLVLKYGGDLKGSAWGAFWDVEYHQHMGTEWPYDDARTEKIEWRYIDILARPMFVITQNLTWGIDYAQRIILEDSKVTNANRYYFDSGSTRVALMTGYNLNNRPFDSPNISLFIGRMFRDKAAAFFKNDSGQREANYLRLNYQISI